MCVRTIERRIDTICRFVCKYKVCNWSLWVHVLTLRRIGEFSSMQAENIIRVCNLYIRNVKGKSIVQG